MSDVDNPRGKGCGTYLPKGANEQEVELLDRAWRTWLLVSEGSEDRIHARPPVGTPAAWAAAYMLC